jgi:hypothetical protein
VDLDDRRGWIHRDALPRRATARGLASYGACAEPASKIGTSAFVFPVAIARRLRPFHSADLLGERLLNSRSDRLRFRRWLGLLGHGRPRAFFQAAAKPGATS